MTNALEHCVAAQKLRATFFLAMPDPIHALLTFPADLRIEAALRDWKRFVAKQTDSVWQDGFFDHRPRNNESLDEKSRYIRMNPFRAGLATESQTWNYVQPDCHDVPARSG